MLFFLTFIAKGKENIENIFINDFVSLVLSFPLFFFFFFNLSMFSIFYGVC